MSDPYVLKNGVFILKGGKAGSGIPLESHVIPHGNSSVGAKLDELSQNLTLSYDNTSYSGQQDINSTLQAILEKVFPKTVNLAYAPSSRWTVHAGSNISYMPFKGSSSSGSALNISVNDVDFTPFTTCVFQADIQTPTRLYYGVTGEWIANYSGQTITTDVSQLTGTHNISIIIEGANTLRINKLELS